MRKVKIEQPEGDAPIPQPVLAQAIVDISAAAKKLAASGLNRRAIVLLVAHTSGTSQTAVKAVLDSLESLTRDYTTFHNTKGK